MNPIVKQFKYGQHTVTLETGAIARQATAAVMASMDDTTVFVTVVAKKEVKEGQDFFFEVYDDEKQIVIFFSEVCELFVFIECPSLYIGIGEVEEFAFPNGFFPIAHR